MPPNPYMQEALKAAKRGAEQGEVPVGAVLVQDQKILHVAHNLVMHHHDPTAHAEILVLREGGTVLKQDKLVDCDLYVTLEPCAMCAQAISFARLRRVFFGAYDPKGGGVDHGPQIFQQPTCHHQPEVIGGMMEKECGDILRCFFKERRER